VLAYNWQKSSYSPNAGNCVYVAAADDGTVKIRESDDPEVIVTTTPEKLKAFILGVKAGEFDHFTA
jgi:putative sterol carrier protein